MRVEACAAYQRAVNLHLRHQSPDVVGLDAAAEQDAKSGGSFGGEALLREFPQVPVSFRSDFRRRRAPRAYGPDRLVS